MESFWDWFQRTRSKDMIRLEQTLGQFKEYFVRLTVPQSQSFSALVRMCSEALLGPDIEDYAHKLDNLGCTERDLIDVQITITELNEGEEVRTASIYPPILKLALEHWKRNEPFTPPWNTTLRI